MLGRNECVELRCDSLGAELEGVCRHEGQVVFVPGLLPGETARVKIIKPQKQYAVARLERLLDASPDRREPPCPYARRCGGCAGQHMAYEVTLRAKERQVRDCLERIGGFDAPDVRPVLGMDDPFRYRNKGAFPVGRAGIGCYAARSHDIIDAREGCLLQSRQSDALVGAVRQWMAETGAPPYDEETHAGLVRHAVTREGTGGAMLLVVAREGAIPRPERLAALAREAAPALRSLILCENNRRTNVILGETFRTLWGEDFIEDTLLGATFRVSPASFFQVNHSQTERLYRTAVDMAAPAPDARVWDVYCGCGTITLALARQAAFAVGVELNPHAVADARENAARNGVSNVRFDAGAAETVLPALPDSPDAVVLDPPRKGCEPDALEAVAARRPARVVYVSCNPATLARDAALLASRGYRLVRVQPVDMFPWTAAIESAALLERI